MMNELTLCRVQQFYTITIHLVTKNQLCTNHWKSMYKFYFIPITLSSELYFEVRSCYI